MSRSHAPALTIVSQNEDLAGTGFEEFVNLKEQFAGLRPLACGVPFIEFE